MWELGVGVGVALLALRTTLGVSQVHPRAEKRDDVQGRRLCPLAIGTERAGTRGGCFAVAIPPVRSEGWCASVKQTTRGVPSLARLWGRTERAACV